MCLDEKTLCRTRAIYTQMLKLEPRKGRLNNKKVSN